MENRNDYQIYKVSNRILFSLNAIKDSSQGKAIMANLRNSIGKPLSETIEVWSVLFEYLPEEFLGSNNKITDEELAIITTVQLYALHQQGISKTVLMEDGKIYENMGYSLSFMRKGDDIKSTDRRYNSMITASDFEEFTYHLRHLINLLKSRNPEAKVNYAKLSEDLYWYLRGYDEKLKLAWSKAYYR